ncbi:MULTISPECIES: hypothetical protein [unclassified Caballeronia]|uniref:hypothetical protein n=1 Tax=unclassified Caballeronia TaxID=2646786 RepID=UPI0028675EFB|nr:MULTISPECIES: hypothetical protein [unclassified Caballeronia]MDR5750363.1 hypothetical protein [Caballeronia sp. LZ024]MDR5842605.1 hypothetical protein [Caballeronia sp. LZ031]
MSALALNCTLEGTVESVVPAALFQGVATLLETCEKGCAPAGDALTVFIRRKTHGGLTPLARIDVLLQSGFAHASMLCEGMPRTDAEPVAVADADDVATIARKVLGLSPRVTVPDDFPHERVPAAVPGVQTKVGAVLLSRGRYALQSDEQRAERWDICEDLVHQLLAKARADAAKHPAQMPAETLERVRKAVAGKGWCSPEELQWLIQRLRALLEEEDLMKKRLESVQRSVRVNLDDL